MSGLDLRPCARFDEPARRALYGGRLLRFDGLPEVAALIGAIAAAIARAMAPHPPLAAAGLLPAGELAARCDALARRAPREAAWNRLLDAALVALGNDPATTYRDRLRLRIQTGDGARDRRTRMTLAAHRDSWGSNLRAQVNWWAPVFEVDAGRTVALWPALFDRAVANDSAGWDLDALLESRRRGETGYPPLPLAKAPRCLGPPLPLVVPPGTVVAFSGAHLHASVPNRGPAMRYSIETRTVCRDDLVAGLGAPDVDGAAPRRPLHWFRRLADGAPLVA